MVDIPVRYLSIRVRTEVRLGVRNLYGICDTALKHTNRTVRAPALPLALLRATVDARRLHRAAPYNEVQALALHTHTRKERSRSKLYMWTHLAHAHVFNFSLLESPEPTLTCFVIITRNQARLVSALVHQQDPLGRVR